MEKIIETLQAVGAWLHVDAVNERMQIMREAWEHSTPNAQTAALFLFLCVWILVAGIIQKLAAPEFEYTVKSPRCWELQVYLNGKRVDRCIYANTLTGKIVRHEEPLRVVDDEVATVIEYGHVHVERVVSK